MVSICRLCLGIFSKEDIENIFEYQLKHGKKSLVDVLFWVFSVEIETTDVFSKEICISCIGLTEHILGMANRFQKNQEILQNGLNLEEFQNRELQKEKDFIEFQNEHRYSSSSKEWVHQSTDSTPASPKIIKVPLSVMEAMYPVRVIIERLEDTQEFLKYHHLGGGKYKKRKYRQFKIDDALVENICNTLVRKQSKNWLNAQTKAENTKNPYYYNRRSCNVLIKNKENILKTNHKAVGTLSNTYSSFNQTTVPFKKDAAKNTMCRPHVQRTRNIAVKTNTKNIELEPKVYLKPLEWIIKKRKYEKIREGTYSIDRHKCDTEECTTEDDSEISKYEDYWEDNAPVKSKKQKFLDYYKNYRTFAVRELITGKNINKKDVEHEVLSVSNVQNVLVCEFCSKVFLNQITLKLHYKRVHNRLREVSDMCEPVEVIDSNGSGSSESSSDEEISKKQKNADDSRSIISTKTTSKEYIRKKRKTRKLKTSSPVETTSDFEDGPYIWDRKKLGKYSAISYYTKNKLGASGRVPNNNVSLRQCSSLNDTIRRLSNRLEDENV